MISIGIIWNSAKGFSNSIIDDIKLKTELIDYFDLVLGDDYSGFVRKIYESEGMEEWKVENKLLHMETSPNREVTVLFFSFDDSATVYHPLKKKNVYLQLEDCKKFIREKYKDKVMNYTFDIIFHATDNLAELSNCLTIVSDYIKKYNNEDLRDQRLQKIKRVL